MKIPLFEFELFIFFAQNHYFVYNIILMIFNIARHLKTFNLFQEDLNIIPVKHLEEVLDIVVPGGLAILKNSSFTTMEICKL